MARQITGGATNVSVTIRIVDSTDGTPETGVVAATAGLVLQYRRELAVPVSLATITNLALLTTAHTDKGILHIANGYYRVDVPDAAFAAGVAGVLITGTATGMVVIGEYFQINPFGVGGVDLDETGGDGAQLTEAGGTGDHLTAINLPNQTMDIVGSITGNLSGSVGSVTGNLGGTINGLTATALADFFDTNSGTTYASAVAGSVVKETADNAGGSALTEAGIADAVWDELMAGHTTVDSAGEGMNDWQDGGRLDLLVDGIQTDLSNGTDGLGALKTLIDTLDTVADGIQTDLSNGTDGLGALKTLIDTVNTDLSNGTDGLGALKTLIDTLDTVADAIKVVTDKFAFTVANLVDSNMLAISGDTGAADNLEAGAKSVIKGSCTGVPTTTVIPASAFTETDVDFYKNQVMSFNTGVLAGQKTDITAYATGSFTVAALTVAPSSGDEFVIT